MKAAFISFVASAILLAAIVSSGAAISGAAPDNAYEKSRAYAIQEIAIKHAFYASVSETAKATYKTVEAYNAAVSSGLGGRGMIDPSAAAEYMANARAALFFSQLNANGYESVLWYGYADGESRKAASREMARKARPVVPSSAEPFASSPAFMHPTKTEGELLAEQSAVFELGSALAAGGLEGGGLSLLWNIFGDLPEARGANPPAIQVVDGRRLHFNSLGFSYYSEDFGIGRAATFPSSYEVPF